MHHITQVVFGLTLYRVLRYYTMEHCRTEHDVHNTQLRNPRDVSKTTTMVIMLATTSYK